DERQAGEAERRDRRVGVAAGVRAAGREVDLLPAQARVGERAARGERRHLQGADALVPAERVDAEAGDRDVVAHPAASGRKANASVPEAPGAGISVSSIAMPISSSSKPTSVSRASTRTSPGSST